MPNTNKQFDEVIKICEDIFVKKLKDYGTAWRILRTSSLTDQIYIKAQRIRTLETTTEQKVDEGIVPEYIGIINYAVIMDRIEIVQILIEFGIDVNRRSFDKREFIEGYDDGSVTALSDACNNDRLEIIQILMRAGAVTDDLHIERYSSTVRKTIADMLAE